MVSKRNTPKPEATEPTSEALEHTAWDEETPVVPKTPREALALADNEDSGYLVHVEILNRAGVQPVALGKSQGWIQASITVDSPSGSVSVVPYLVEAHPGVFVKTDSEEVTRVYTSVPRTAPDSIVARMVARAVAELEFDKPHAPAWWA